MRVYAYLASASGLVYWDAITQGTYQSFMLYVHEVVELGCYVRDAADPWTRRASNTGYHAEALLIEHRLIQGAASVLGLHVPTLRDLVISNPSVSENDAFFDWEALTLHCSYALSDEDQLSDTVDSAARVYEQLNFKPLGHQ